MLASIPSPAEGIVHIGPVPLHAYGLMLAIGVIVAATIGEKRWVKSGHDQQQFAGVVVPCVIGGVVGARVYHLFTGYDWDDGGVVGALKIWKGGLSIWGAVAGGLIVFLFLARKRNIDTLAFMDAVAPGIVLAQAIGRWGNYFNQELFGKPTTLPWGLEIDLAHRPVGYEHYETFHPTFLYESLWCLAVFGFLLYAEKRFAARRGQVFALYVALYTLGRVLFESLRIDEATKLFGLRFNLMVSIVLCVFGFAWFVWLGRRDERSEASPTPEAEHEI